MLKYGIKLLSQERLTIIFLFYGPLQPAMVPLKTDLIIINCGSSVIAAEQYKATALLHEQHCYCFGDYSHFFCFLRLKLSRGTINAANIGQAMVN